MSKLKKQRFLILPGNGISGPAMQASLFQERAAQALTDDIQLKLAQFSGRRGAAAIAAPSTPDEIASKIDEEDFKVISQRFDDGPATVELSTPARLALKAANPDLRILPITHYFLPEERPRTKDGVKAASLPAEESALDASGAVFSSDFKTQFVGALSGGNEGHGVTIGVIDTGVDSTHPALQSQVAVLRCYVPDAPPGAGGPVNWGPANAHKAGHGTHVAGIIAAAPGHGGPAGVAPRAKLISYRVFPDHPSSRKPAENPAIIDSIRAAIDDQCHIINLSIEGRTLKEDGVATAIADAWENGVVCIAAAGNGFGNPVGYPAALQHCVAVTAIGREGTYPNRPTFTRFETDQRASTEQTIFLASFSNYGPPVQFTAPGLGIVSTFPGGEWWFSSGTSMAAPFISGLLARLLSDNQNILNMFGDAERSSAMVQMLIGRARLLGLPQPTQEGYGLPA